MSSIEIDIGMIFIAAAVNTGLGMLWYSPSVFGKRWMKLVGMTARSKPKDMGLVYSLAFLVALVSAFFLEVLIESMPSPSPVTGIFLGFWVGLGFVATTSFSEYLFNPKAKSKELYFINVGFHVASFVIMGLLLGI